MLYSWHCWKILTPSVLSFCWPKGHFLRSVLWQARNSSWVMAGALALPEAILSWYFQLMESQQNGFTFKMVENTLLAILWSILPMIWLPCRPLLLWQFGNFKIDLDKGKTQTKIPPCDLMSIHSYWVTMSDLGGTIWQTRSKRIGKFLHRKGNSQQD